MAEPWIRVHAAIGEKRVSIRAAEELGVSLNEAIGLLVRFWGAMSRLGNEGSVTVLTDREIETWGGWERKKGKFAAFIRAHHTDDDGRVNEWDEYAGKLEDRRAKDRDRQRHRRELRAASRGASTNGHAERPRDITPESVPARAVRDETRRNETKRDETRTASSPPPAAAEMSVAAAFASDADRAALEQLLSLVPNRLTWAAEMLASLTAMPGHVPLTGLQLGEAIRDYVGNGAATNPNLSHFRGYLRNAAKDPEPTPPRPRAGGGGSRNDAAIDSWLAKAEAREAAEAAQTAEAVHGKP